MFILGLAIKEFSRKSQTLLSQCPFFPHKKKSAFEWWASILRPSPFTPIFAGSTVITFFLRLRRQPASVLLLPVLPLLLFLRKRWYIIHFSVFVVATPYPPPVTRTWQKVVYGTNRNLNSHPPSPSAHPYPWGMRDKNVRRLQQNATWLTMIICSGASQNWRLKRGKSRTTGF